MQAAHTFLFADLAGFTALTEAHGDATAADLAIAFCADVRGRLPPGRAEVVKAIGDAVMVRFDDAAAAVRTGIVVAGEPLAGHGAPAVRVGMHTGVAVERDGDYYGTTVNLAARIAALAGADQVLLSDTARAAAGAADGVAFADHGEHRVRNVSEPVRLWRAEPAGRDAGRLPVDPVCRMSVDPARAAGSLVHAGRRYEFCSLECAARFAAVPERYG